MVKYKYRVQKVKGKWALIERRRNESTDYVHYAIIWNSRDKTKVNELANSMQKDEPNTVFSDTDFKIPPDYDFSPFNIPPET